MANEYAGGTFEPHIPPNQQEHACHVAGTISRKAAPRSLWGWARRHSVKESFPSLLNDVEAVVGLELQLD